MGLKTIVLKLHKPSKAKQRIIDEALFNYNEALRCLLGQVYPKLTEISRELKQTGKKYSALTLSKWIDSDMSCELNKFGVQPFKDSLKVDFGNITANYLRNSVSRVGESDDEQKSFSDAAQVCFDEDGISDLYPQYNSSRYKFKNKFYPIYFCRYDIKRSYCLLYDRVKDRLYVKLYLLNRTNARVACSSSGNNEKLEFIYKNGGIQERTGKKETFIILPLSFGKWQEKILKEAAANPECFRTARLFKKNDEYYLAVSIEMGKSEIIETKAFMGVSRGLKSKLSYTIVNQEGQILDFGMAGAVTGSKASGGVKLNELHSVANIIRDIAERYKAQIVLLNFSGKDDRLAWRNMEGECYYPELNQREYNCFSRLLEYKLNWACLPRPVKVSPAGNSSTCPVCGLKSKKNRFGMYHFICINCGTTMDIDALASLNLARRLINYNNSKIKIGITKVDNGILFTNAILGLNCISCNNENHLENLRDDLEEIIKGDDNVYRSSDISYSARISLIKKLESSEDFIDILEFSQ